MGIVFDRAGSRLGRQSCFQFAARLRGARVCTMHRIIASLPGASSHRYGIGILVYPNLVFRPKRMTECRQRHAGSSRLFVASAHSDQLDRSQKIKLRRIAGCKAVYLLIERGHLLKLNRLVSTGRLSTIPISK
jgi:hypothetical protein